SIDRTAKIAKIAKIAEIALPTRSFALGSGFRPKALARLSPRSRLSTASIWTLWQLSILAIVVSSQNGPLSRLLNNLRNGSRTHGPSAFADGEPQSLLHGYRRDQLDGQGHVVARHHHLRPARQLRHSRHVRGAEVELRTITLEERRMPPAFFLRQHVNFGLELGVRRNRSRLGQHHPALHVFLRRASEQQPGIVARHAFIQLHAEGR